MKTFNYKRFIGIDERTDSLRVCCLIEPKRRKQKKQENLCDL